MADPRYWPWFTYMPLVPRCIWGESLGIDILKKRLPGGCCGGSWQRACPACEMSLKSIRHSRISICRLCYPSIHPIYQSSFYIPVYLSITWSTSNLFAICESMGLIFYPGNYLSASSSTSVSFSPPMYAICIHLSMDLSFNLSNLPAHLAGDRCSLKLYTFRPICLSFYCIYSSSITSIYLSTYVSLYLYLYVYTIRLSYLCISLLPSRIYRTIMTYLARYLSICPNC